MIVIIIVSNIEDDDIYFCEKYYLLLISITTHLSKIDFINNIHNNLIEKKESKSV